MELILLLHSFDNIFVQDCRQKEIMYLHRIPYLQDQKIDVLKIIQVVVKKMNRWSLTVYSKIKESDLKDYLSKYLQLVKSTNDKSIVFSGYQIALVSKFILPHCMEFEETFFVENFLEALKFYLIMYSQTNEHIKQVWNFAIEFSVELKNRMTKDNKESIIDLFSTIASMFKDVHINLITYYWYTIYQQCKTTQFVSEVKQKLEEIGIIERENDPITQQ